MRRRHGLALLFLLLPTLCVFQSCGQAMNTNSFANTNGNRSLGPNLNASTSPTPAPGDPTGDELKKRLGVGDIAFNVPPSMKLDEAQTIELLLSRTQTAAQLGQELQKKGAPGDIQKHTIPVSDEMQAVLTGDGFQITPITPDRQPVGNPTRWRWDVRALRGGTLKLHVVLNAIVELKQGERRRPYFIDSFDHVYILEVPSPSPAPVALARGGRIWPWLLPAVLVPAIGVAAWLWLRGKRRRRAAKHWFKPGAVAPRVFISYRRDDTAGHAGRLRDSLAERFGPERVFMDLESIRAGDDFVEILQKAVDSAGVVVVLIGRRWLSAADGRGGRRLDDPHDFVRMEVAAALGRGLRVIPALVQDASMPTADALPEPLAPLARRNAVEISDARWAFDVERLADAIEEALPG